jgi:hypothetical protein
MAVYKIFPSQDATIYSNSPESNAGRDEVLEISSLNSNAIAGFLTTGDDIRRTLIAFSDSDLDIIKGFATGSFSVKLKMFLAYASALPQTYTIECYPISQSWVMGTGKFADSPNPKNGVSWYSVGAYSETPNWSTSPGTQAFLYTTGGGTWNSQYTASQTFDYISDKDINLDVTNIAIQWFSGSIPNYGLLLKQTSSLELTPSSSLETKFFSMDTHTIYPPCLEMKWDDSVYSTGSNINGVVKEDDFVLLAENNLGYYKEGNKYRMKFKVRDRFPVRNFTTSSEYLNWKYLPQQSYWAIQDYKTKEMIIDFDTNYTKLSADSSGNYFILYTNGLQPERSYKVLVKADLNNTGEEVVVDNDIIFKINR